MKKRKVERFICIICVVALFASFSVMGAYYFTKDKNKTENILDSSKTSAATKDKSNENAEIEFEGQQETEEESSTSTETDMSEKQVVDNNEQIELLLKGMSLEEKIYQMMFVTPEALTGAESVSYAGKQTEESLKKYPVGGIIYFGANIKNRDQVKEMIENTQSYSDIPLFIGIDEEGGRVSRLGSANIGVTKHPAMKIIGDSGDASRAREVGNTLGIELSELGFNVDFAPVADVNVNSANTEIGDRSFGTDPNNVATMVSEIVNGLESNNVSSVLKHFPGHGSTTFNSHYGNSESTRTLDELRNNEFIPFKAGIDAGADFVMVSHMTLVNAIEENVPATLSKEVISGMLKSELGFNGIVITDAFNMGAIAKNYSTEDAVVKSIDAGADMILMPLNLQKAHGAVLKAVKDGRIAEERINDSVRKILKVKMG